MSAGSSDGASSNNEGGASAMNYSGIPVAKFVEDVDEFMSQPGHETIEKVLRALDEQYCKYRFMLQNLNARKSKLTNQIPDLQKSLEMITQLSARRKENLEAETHFLLSDQVYVKAAIPPTDKVYLWLGANVMLEYSLEDAIEMLNKNESTAKIGLEKVVHDLDFLRDQLTTMEVNMARVYNWNVRRKQKAAGNMVA